VFTPVVGGYITLIGRKRSVIIGCVMKVCGINIIINLSCHIVGCLCFLRVFSVSNEQVTFISFNSLNRHLIILVALLLRILQGIANALI
jgi:MFS family permease